MIFPPTPARASCALIALLFTASQAGAISTGQRDAFDDGSTQSWVEGPPSPNPPELVPGGGPAGAGDAFLRNASSGEGAAGSRMAMFNTAQWAGDYRSARVAGITADVINLGSNALYLRIAITARDFAGAFASADAHEVQPGGTWQRIRFDLNDADLTSLFGDLSVADVLADVIELRIVSAKDAPAGIGDAVDAVLGIDNITAVPVPAGLALMASSLGALLLSAYRRA